MKKVMLFMVFAAVCLGRLGPSDETCCPTRDLGRMPIPMPAGQEQDPSDYYQGAALSPLHWDAIESADCPEITIIDLDAKTAAEDIVVKIDAAWRKQKGLPPAPDPWKPSPPGKDMDYVLRGTLTADQVTGKDLSGNLEGKFTFRLELIEQFPVLARPMVHLLTLHTPQAHTNNPVSKSTLHWKATKLGQKD